MMSPHHQRWVCISMPSHSTSPEHGSTRCVSIDSHQCIGTNFTDLVSSGRTQHHSVATDGAINQGPRKRPPAIRWANNSAAYGVAPTPHSVTTVSSFHFVCAIFLSIAAFVYVYTNLMGLGIWGKRGYCDDGEGMRVKANAGRRRSQGSRRGVMIVSCTASDLCEHSYVRLLLTVDCKIQRTLCKILRVPTFPRLHLQICLCSSPSAF